jgi:peptidoglycan/LPS O-acetylase OafA/YrhL
LMARAVAAGLRFPKPSLAFAASLVWLGALVGVGAFYSLDHSHGLPRPLVLLVALPAFAAMLISAASKDLRHEESILTGRKLTYLGMISFELYLVHKPLFLAARPLGVWNNSGGLEGVLVFAGFLGIAIVFAIALHHIFQAPIERVLTRTHHPLRWSRCRARRLKSAMTYGVERVARKPLWRASEAQRG